uniref:Apolipoprotein D n=1 Tax=Haemonchus contortus TaxID=6289 RepID=A0A7I4YGM9_HAECO
MRPLPTLLSFLFISVAILILAEQSSAECRVQLSYPVLQPAQYNGSWFVIARKAPSSRSFLPANVNSSMIRLQMDGEERLNMTEYHSICSSLQKLIGRCSLYRTYCSSRTLDTYTACGDEVVDEDQKLIHARIDDNNEFVDVECQVENQQTPITNIRSFFDEPRVLTVTAYIDSALSNEQIAHISCIYVNKTSATCEWIRQNICFKTQLHQSFNGESSLKMISNYTRLDGNETNIDWSGTVIWENGDEYISMHCNLIGEDGACDSWRVYVWSDEDHMDQPTIHEIYRQLQAFCIDPTDLIFLNTFHECTNQTQTTDSSEPCGVVEGWTPLNTAMLQGVWYFAADLNADPKIFLQSAVITLTPNETNPSSVMNLRYYAQKEADSECVGPREGTAILLSNSTLDVTIEYRYTLVPQFRNRMNFKYQVLYIDNQRAALYWCYRRAENGSCIQHDVNFMIRSRHFSYNDLSMMLPYLEKVCIEKDNLRWFDLHSQCGSEMSASTRLRRDLVTLSHYDVLHILTNVQEPKCLAHEVSGVQADLAAIEKAGTWFLMARFDEMALDTYAMVMRLTAVSETAAVLRLFQSAALPGEPLDCFTRVFTVKEVQNGTDYYYELHFESSTKNSTTMIFRFLFFNRHVGVLYSCLSISADGRCKERAIYVISRHETIDHAELIVLEKVANAVCVDPQVLYHTATFDECVYDHAQLRPPLCSTVDVESSIAEWEHLNTDQIMHTYGQLKYHAVASNKLIANPFALRFDGKVFQKITESPSGCTTAPASIEFSARNRLLVRVDGDIVLLHPTASRSELYLKEAQLTGSLPCLYPIEPSNSTCDELMPPVCEGATSLRVAEQLHGEWVLHAADPTYVLNWKCQVKPYEVDQHEFICQSEGWFGECERETRAILTVDAWGGFRLTSESPLHVPSELMSSGNISVTPDRLILIRDGDLVGRRYSVWVRPDYEPGNELADELSRFCIWPLPAQTCTRVSNC